MEAFISAMCVAPAVAVGLGVTVTLLQVTLGGRVVVAVLDNVKSAHCIDGGQY